MPKKLIPMAIGYDFDGTLAPGNMQEYDFIPALNMVSKAFWSSVNTLAQQHEMDHGALHQGLPGRIVVASQQSIGSSLLQSDAVTRHTRQNALDRRQVAIRALPGLEAHHWS